MESDGRTCLQLRQMLKQIFIQLPVEDLWFNGELAGLIYRPGCLDSVVHQFLQPKKGQDPSESTSEYRFLFTLNIHMRNKVRQSDFQFRLKLLRVHLFLDFLIYRQLTKAPCGTWDGFLTECRKRRLIQGQLVVYIVFIVFSCLGLLSCIELCIFLCPLVLFTLVISFVSKGFPYKDQIEESFIVMVYCMFSQHVALSTFSLIHFLTATYL